MLGTVKHLTIIALVILLIAGSMLIYYYYQYNHQYIKEAVKTNGSGIQNTDIDTGMVTPKVTTQIQNATMGNITTMKSSIKEHPGGLPEPSIELLYQLGYRVVAYDELVDYLGMKPRVPTELPDGSKLRVIIIKTFSKNPRKAFDVGFIYTLREPDMELFTVYKGVKVPKYVEADTYARWGTLSLILIPLNNTTYLRQVCSSWSNYVKNSIDPKYITKVIKLEDTVVVIYKYRDVEGFYHVYTCAPNYYVEIYTFGKDLDTALYLMGEVLRGLK
ncbi:MAG TPA: hypothetical protein ENF75_03425 [Acidilobales archaeon]|nr:hypothetical protein [Acidilobales archaeon]